MTDGFSIIVDMYASLWGISGNGMLLLISVCISLAMALLIIHKFKNKDLGIVTFFCLFALTALVGWVSWVAVVLPLIVVAFLRFYMLRGGNN